ncbi:hypothetical protein F4824DRAFT_465974 [Ustulina deusta]|nr:hypothetical protein F4824DRAFT_465974 [Ustulina deusta]
MLARCTGGLISAVVEALICSSTSATGVKWVSHALAINGTAAGKPIIASQRQPRNDGREGQTGQDRRIAAADGFPAQSAPSSAPLLPAC